MGANSSRARYEYGYGDQAYDPYTRARARDLGAGNPYYRQPMGMMPAGYPAMQPQVMYPMVMQQPFQQFAGQQMAGQVQPGAAGVPVIPPNSMMYPQVPQAQFQPNVQPQPQIPLSTGPQFAHMPQPLDRVPSTSSSDYDSRDRRRRRRRRRRSSWERDPLDRNPLPALPRSSRIPDDMLAGTAMAPGGPRLPRAVSPLRRNPLPPPPRDVYRLRKYRDLLSGTSYADMEEKVYPRGWFSDEESRDGDTGLGRIFERLNPFRGQRESGFSPRSGYGHRRHATMPELPRLPEFARESSGSMSESTETSLPMRRPFLGRSFSSRIPFMRRRRGDILGDPLARVAEGPEPPVGFMANSPAISGPTGQPQPAHPLSPMGAGPQPARPFSPQPHEPRPMVPPDPSGMPEPVIPGDMGGMPAPAHPLTPGPPGPMSMVPPNMGLQPHQAGNPFTPGPPPMGMPTPGRRSMEMPGLGMSQSLMSGGPRGMPSPVIPFDTPMAGFGGPPPMGMPTPGRRSMEMSGPGMSQPPMPGGPRSMTMPEPGGPQPRGMPSPAIPFDTPMSGFGGPPPMGMPTPGRRSMEMPGHGFSQPRSMSMPEPGGPQSRGMPGMSSPVIPQDMSMHGFGGLPPMGMPNPGAPPTMGMPTPGGSQPMAMPEPGVSQSMGMPTPGLSGPTAARPFSPFIPPLVAGEGPGPGPGPGSIFPSSRFRTNSNATLPLIRFDQDTPGYGGLCRLSPHRVLYREELYPSAAHLFEAFRFLGWRDDLASRVRMAQTIHELGEVLGSIERYTREDWESILLDKMEDALYYKIVQHEELCDLLLGTGNAELVYADPNDGFWGEGEDEEGANELGRALMRVRDRLRREAINH